MAKILQFRRDTTAGLATTLGAEAEFFYDTTKKTIVVMDGTTTGGVTLAREDGQNATGLWPISITGSSNTANFASSSNTAKFATSSNTAGGLVNGFWEITFSGSTVLFKNDNVAVARLDSTGNLVCIGNVTAFGTL